MTAEVAVGSRLVGYTAEQVVEAVAVRQDRAAFWPPLGTDPIITDIYRSGRYRVDALPRTAIEFLDRLRQLGYSIRKDADLDVQHPSSQRRVQPFEGDDRVLIGVGSGEELDRGRDALGVGEVHEGSSRCGCDVGSDVSASPGGDAPVARSVEAAADSAAVSAGAPLVPGRPAAATGGGGDQEVSA